MVKKSKSSVKEETDVSETEFYIPTPSGGIIDFYIVFNGFGILLTIAMIIYLINNYVFHIL